jgi:hypothetical protein
MYWRGLEFGPVRPTAGVPLLAPLSGCNKRNLFREKPIWWVVDEAVEAWGAYAFSACHPCELRA